MQYGYGYAYRLRKEKGLINRTGVVVGIITGLAGLVAGAWAIADAGPQAGVAAYRAQVLVTCAQAHDLLARKHPEIFVPTPAGLAAAPSDLPRVDKDRLLPVLEAKLSGARTLFDDLNRKPVPSELTASHADAVSSQQRWLVSFEQLIVVARDQLPHYSSPGELNGLRSATAHAQEGTRLNGAMSALAGRSCQVTA